MLLFSEICVTLVVLSQYTSVTDIQKDNFAIATYVRLKIYTELKEDWYQEDKLNLHEFGKHLADGARFYFGKKIASVSIKSDRYCGASLRLGVLSSVIPVSSSRLPGQVRPLAGQ